MNMWLIVLGGAVVGTIIMLALDWSGFRAAMGSLAIGVIVGVPTMIFTGNPAGLYIAIAVCIILGIIWHFIVKLAIGKG